MEVLKTTKTAPGLRLAKRVWRSFAEAGIFAPAQVSLEHQHLAQRYVVRGVEAGGAVADIGRDIHRFREKGILEFLRRHPEEINLGKVDAIWFPDLVLLNGRVIGEETAHRRKGECDEEAEIEALGFGHAESG